MRKYSRVILDLKSHRHARHSRGALVAEMAVCLPILIWLTFAIIEYGIVINTTITLTQLTRDTARFVAIHGGEATTADASASTTGSIRAFLQTECSGTSINYSDLTLTVGTLTAPGVVTPNNASARTQGSTETVQISYPLGKKISVSAKFIPGLSAFIDPNAPYVKRSSVIMEKVPG
ncbi:hypothetical protein CCAX7_48630 [Capsulimonas corticalis]|uniref:Uncharacterized protein n=1 Tax=Capsulimonas corticalis TaxID=2219043 RepID=A0A402CQ18_9BACT|nr:TadE/TadG family type IV pilus assembly protein [Capsulimonas corticalis]BDI32812.1 hypothetical protein CCAX7_48630 [Capsulimonas corticalis]